MKIKSVTIYALKIPFVENFSHHTKVRKFSDSIIVRLVSDDGIIGYGEGAPREYVTGETTESCINYIKSVLWPIVSQTDYTDVIPDEDSIAFISNISNDWPNLRTDEVIAWHSAICVMETAILDCILRKQNKSLSDLLPPRRKNVIYSGVISVSSSIQVARYAKHLKLIGLEHFKLKVNGKDERERIAVVRNIIGPSASLRIDANGAYDVSSAVEMLKGIKEFDIACVEQPLPRGSVSKLVDVRKQSPAPLMVDESLVTLKDADELIESNACDYFNIRVSKCGGISRTLKIANKAHRHGVCIQIGCHVGETAILSSIGRCIAAYLDDIDFVEGSFGNLLLTEDIAENNINFGYGGKAPILNGVAFGITVREDVLREYSTTVFDLNT